MKPTSRKPALFAWPTTPLHRKHWPSPIFKNLQKINNALPLLSVQNLCVDFSTHNGAFRALHAVSFTIRQGETVAVVGESGSGKSVTSLSILQLLPAPPAKYVEGSILFSPNGEQQVDLLKLSPADIRNIRGDQISMIFQEPMTSLNPLYTCGNQVMEAITQHRQISPRAARQKTIELFEKVQLPDPLAIFGRYPHQLSGGQKQRVMIAMAMSCEPLLLIADEPTTALDVTVQQNILRLIKQLRQEKQMGVIFISHDLGLVADIADRVIVMYKGKIVEQGDIITIFKKPAHPYTRALLNCRPALHPKHERLPVVSDFMDTGSDGEIVEKIKPPVTNTGAGSSLHASSPASGAPLIKAEHVKVWFPKEQRLWGGQQQYIKAVDDVSFEIYKGETVGLVGESGCGKTTLGRSLLQLIQPTSGQVYFKGTGITSFNPKQLAALRKEIQIIFQDPYSSLNPRLTIGSAIMEAMQVHNIGLNDQDRRERTILLLQKVDLKPEHFTRYPHEFSGGQRQRIGIARALALHPSFVVCDESVSALDMSVQAQVLNMLNDLKKEFGFAALFISHDLSVVRYISDRILVMYKGKIVETGKADEIYIAPRHEYTRKLIAAVPAIV
ncbi:MAG: ABC transporter ATP-binding protein [Chitinophagaceae bacterium]|nr:ABC transporter ATP-binding protein [Chitinophagaceae bacterium]